jgi:hypothetical protein
MRALHSRGYDAGVSWDVLFQDLPPGIRSIADIADDFRPGPLCGRGELVAAIQKAAPTTRFSGPYMGTLDADGFSIEFNADDGDPVRAVMLHIRGGGDALAIVHALSIALGRPAIDCSAGELMDFDSPEVGKGFAAWRAYRDQSVRGPR